MTVAQEQEFRGTERFDLQRRLGAGGFGVVYQAFDRERQVAVALKALRDGNVEALFRLKREFRALADIAHAEPRRHCYELLVDGGQWFFTMELDRGRQLPAITSADGRFPSAAPRRSRPSRPPRGRRTRHRPPAVSSRAAREMLALALDAAEDPESPTPPPVDPDRLRSALRQAVAGVQALHRAGQLHRDIKPSNVLVTREGRLDAARLRHGHGPVRDGIPNGASPSSALRPTCRRNRAPPVPLSEATDWYSLGVMLFEALTGQWPFTGSFIEMMWDKRHKDAVCAPRSGARSYPRTSTRSAATCSAGSPPADRAATRSWPGSAPSRGRRIARSRRRRPHPRRALRSSGARSTLRCCARRWTRRERGAAVVVRLHGPSGAGKTALARRFLESARRAGVVVLAGRCYERESVPYKALDSLVDSLSQFLKKLPAAEANEILPRDVLGSGQALSGPPARGVDRGSAAPRSRDPGFPGAAPSRLRRVAGAADAARRAARRRPLHRRSAVGRCGQRGPPRRPAAAAEAARVAVDRVLPLRSRRVESVSAELPRAGRSRGAAPRRSTCPSGS